MMILFHENEHFIDILVERVDYSEHMSQLHKTKTSLIAGCQKPNLKYSEQCE